MKYWGSKKVGKRKIRWSMAYVVDRGCVVRGTAPLSRHLFASYCFPLPLFFSLLLPLPSFFFHAFFSHPPLVFSACSEKRPPTSTR